jgi:periplasmic protein TonB
MNLALTTDCCSAVRRDERTGFLLGLAASCGVHGIALAAALILYAKHEAMPPPVVSSAPPIVARMMTETMIATPQGLRETAASSAVRRESPAVHARKAIAPMPPEANVRRPAVQEAPPASAVSESAHPEQVAQRDSGALTASIADTSHAVNEPVVPPSFNANYLDNPAPVYPPAARRLHEQGRVLLLVDVAPDGIPRQVSLATSSGSPRLDEAALDAVRRWRFVPARKGTTAVPAQVLVPIVFGLTG